jgi:hypothetical protein
MTREELEDFGKAVLIEFLENRISRIELNDWHCLLLAFKERKGSISGVFYSGSDEIIIRNDRPYAEMLETLYHEVGHRTGIRDEEKTALYAWRRFCEWKRMTDEQKRKKIVEGVLRLNQRGST